jgi:glycosyltransferase involved in cell wall biosynthesis
MRKVVIVANSSHGGGAENAMMLLLQIFKKQGVDALFIAINDMESGPEFTEENVLFLGRKWSTGFLKTLQCLRSFKKVLKSLEPNVVIVNCELPELFVAFTRRSKSKLIIVEHTSKPWEGRRILGFSIRSILRVKQSTWVTVNSKQLTIWPFGQPATYIPNPIAPVVKDGEVLSDSEVAFVGRLRKEKCPELVIQACQQAMVSLKLFGEGNQGPELMNRYGTSSTIDFKGYLENPWRHISSNSLVVVASEYEGDGLVVLEAIQNGNGILLRDNKDFRRFNLADEHYFMDKDSLVPKLMAFKENGRRFKLSESEQGILLGPRSPQIVGKQWVSLIDGSLESTR